ncbi:choice-of-anchor A domain-containing protein [Agromyces sp. 3263]|uniref:choice-of-anchor A family protein n=1 Tax=Agromyces sp. 3263 TaxID=2817750 RepID=UPI0028589FF7|nr:choice-of-anchor A family protein [Agromyces sp. 3263]MDR6906710.1 choice-of-anchor A domain-containing protein [Agromyces sp. 3263]
MPKRVVSRATAIVLACGIAAVALVAGSVTVGQAPAARAAIGECPPDGGMPGIDNLPPEFTDNTIAIFAGGSFTATGGAAEAEGLLVALGDAVFAKDAGGRFNVGSVGVGSGIVPTPGSVMLAVGGGVTIGDGTVLDVGAGLSPDGGSVDVGGTATVTDPLAQIELNGGVFTDGLGADAVAPYAGFGTVISDSAATLAAMAVTGTTAVAAPSVTFTGDGTAAPQVFSITATDLQASPEIRFVGIGLTTPVVINVTGTSAVFSPNFFSNDGSRVDDFANPDFGNVAARTLWNFAGASDVTIGGSSQVLGSILVADPAATVSISASTNGRVYSGGDLVVDGVGNELHNYPWIGTGDFACDEEQAPEDVTGSLTIEKVLDEPGPIPEEERTFGGLVSCTDQSTRAVTAWTAVAGAGPVTIAGLPVGAECAISEDLRFTDPPIPRAAVPPGFIFAVPEWSVNGVPVDAPVTVTIPAPDDPVQLALAVENTVLSRFAVVKAVDGPDGGYIGDRAFPVDYACTLDGAPVEAYSQLGVPLGPGSGTGTLDAVVDAPVTSPYFPITTVCALTEPGGEESGDFSDPSFQWGDVIIDPTPVTVGAGNDPLVAVTVTNAYLRLLGAFTIGKVVANPDGVGFDGPFTGSFTCTSGSATVATGTWSVGSGGTTAPIAVPVGSTCRVAEDVASHPPGGSWSAPVIAPAEFTIDDEATLVAVTVTNTLARDTTGGVPSTGAGSIAATGADPAVPATVAAMLLAGGLAVMGVSARRRRRSGA